MYDVGDVCISTTVNGWLQLQLACEPNQNRVVRTYFPPNIQHGHFCCFQVKMKRHS